MKKAILAVIVLLALTFVSSVASAESLSKFSLTASTGSVSLELEGDLLQVGLNEEGEVVAESKLGYLNGSLSIDNFVTLPVRGFSEKMRLYAFGEDGNSIEHYLTSVGSDSSGFSVLNHKEGDAIGDNDFYENCTYSNFSTKENDFVADKARCLWFVESKMDSLTVLNNLYLSIDLLGQRLSGTYVDVDGKNHLVEVYLNVPDLFSGNDNLIDSFEVSQTTKVGETVYEDKWIDSRYKMEVFSKTNISVFIDGYKFKEVEVPAYSISAVYSLISKQ